MASLPYVPPCITQVANVAEAPQAATASFLKRYSLANTVGWHSRSTSIAQASSTIVVTDHKTPWVNGLWVVKDKMAHSKKIDFLVHRSKGHTFRNSTCTIRKKLEGEVIPAYSEDEELD